MKFIYEDFKWVDRAFNGWWNRNDLIMFSDLRIPTTGKEHYATYFRYTDDMIEYFKNNIDAKTGKNSVGGYRGEHYADYLPIDVDEKENIAKALKSTRHILNTLENQYGLDLGTVKVYYSGSKGFHIMLPSQLFGFEPSKDLSQIFKNIVSELVQDVKLDTTIYEVVRLFRLPNTVNDKANRYKIPLSISEVMSLDIKEMQDMAVNPREVDFLPPSEIELNESLNELYLKVKERFKNKKKPKLELGKDIQTTENMKNVKLCYHNIITKGAIDGNRDNTALRLANYYKKLGYPVEVTTGIMNGWNSMLSPVLDDVDKFIKQSYNNNYDFGCNDGVLKDYCSKKCYLYKGEKVEENKICSVEDLQKKYEDYIENLSKRKILLGIDKLDENLRGIAPGEVMQIIARSAVGKTAFLLNLIKNVCANDIPVLFFSLEMQGEQIYERIAQISAKLKGLEVEKEFQAKSTDNITKFVNSGYKNLYVVDQDFLTMEDLIDYIRIAEEKKGIRFGAICIDYMGRMKGVKGNEYEVVSELAKQLKYIAKETDKAIISLHQTNRTGGTGEGEIEMDMARGSGVVEEAADQILGLWRPNINDKDLSKLDQELVNIKILKNRKGGTGIHPMILDKPRLRFYEMDEAEDMNKPQWVVDAEKNTQMEVWQNDNSM